MRLADLPAATMREDDVNVVVLLLAQGQPGHERARLMVELDALIRHRSSYDARFVVVWAVQRAERREMWTVEDPAGRVRNVATLTYASAWPGRMDLLPSVSRLVETRSAEVVSLVGDLARTTDLVGESSLLLLSYLELLDPRALHVLLCEPLTGARSLAGWHGFAAVRSAVMVVRSR